jgi:hypothetical protein
MKPESVLGDEAPFCALLPEKKSRIAGTIFISAKRRRHLAIKLIYSRSNDKSSVVHAVCKAKIHISAAPIAISLFRRRRLAAINSEVFGNDASSARSAFTTFNYNPQREQKRILSKICFWLHLGQNINTSLIFEKFTSALQIKLACFFEKSSLAKMICFY